MNSDQPSHFVYVDFENVPNVDLELTAGKPVHVTLLIGEKQKRLDLALVRQIHQHASQVTLIEVGASGRNALDLVLACHLGKAVAQHAGAEFHIISKDKDFDPLITHLRAEKMHVSRHNAFADLPLVAAHRHRAPAAAASPAATKTEKLIARLQNPDKSRPKRKKSLLAHINTTCGNNLSEAEQATLLDDLIARQVLTVDDAGRVTYASDALKR